VHARVVPQYRVIQKELSEIYYSVTKYDMDI